MKNVDNGTFVSLLQRLRKPSNLNSMDTEKRVVPPTLFVLLIWFAKPETSHALQSNKNKTYWGRCNRLSMSIDRYEWLWCPKVALY